MLLTLQSDRLTIATVISSTYRFRILPISIAAGMLFFRTALLTQSATLIDCPDCGKEVSSRAVMCPGCGCPGEAIAEVAIAIKREEQAKELPIAQIKTDLGSGYGVAASAPDGNFIFLPQNLVEGVTTLAVTLPKSGTTVAYRSLELATDTPLARLSTVETNINYAAISTPKSRGDSAWLGVSVTKDTLIVNATSPDELSDEDLFVFDSKTNLVSVLTEAAHCRVIAAKDWVQVNPADFRRQSKLLIEAESSEIPLTAEAKKELLTEKWPTKYLEDRAKSLASDSKAGGRK